jgi:hypothetical protein
LDFAFKASAAFRGLQRAISHFSGALSPEGSLKGWLKPPARPGRAAINPFFQIIFPTAFFGREKAREKTKLNGSREA